MSLDTVLLTKERSKDNFYWG